MFHRCILGLCSNFVSLLLWLLKKDYTYLFCLCAYICMCVGTPAMQFVVIGILEDLVSSPTTWVLALELKSWSSGLVVSTFTCQAACWPMLAVGTEKWGVGVSLQFSQCLPCLLRSSDVAVHVYNSFILLLIE